MSQSMFMVSFGGKEFGPHSKDEIASMVRADMIDDTAMLRSGKDWVKLSSVMVDQGKPHEPLAPLDATLDLTPNPGVPEYLAIVNGAKLLLFQAELADVLGWAIIAIGVLVSLWGISNYKSAEDIVRILSPFLAGLFGGLACFAYAALTRLIAALAMAHRDLVRQSFL